MTRFCKDCVHCIPALAHSSPTDQLDYSRCARARADWIDLVSGGNRTELLFCFVERRSRVSDSCGPKGVHFEPKAP
jgi:hypothetical protein